MINSPSPTAPDRWLSAILVLGSLGIFLALAWPLFQGRIYIEDDLAALYLPIRSFYSNCLARGENFLWMPHLANGFYIHGEGHGGFFHPVHYGLYSIFSLDTAFMLELLVSYPFMYLGTFLFMKRWHGSNVNALLAALLLTFMGCSMNHYVHISIVAVLSHLPWALLSIDLAMRAPKSNVRTWGVAGVILLSTSQIYIGHPQALYFSWLVEMFYALLMAIRTRAIFRLGQLGFAKVLALLLGAAQLLPTFAVHQASVRQDHSLAYQLGISLHPYNLFQFVSPYLFHKRVYAPLSGDEPWDAVYFGAAASLLIPFLVLQIFSLKRSRPLALAALGLIVFALLAALGKYGFLYHVLTRIPVVNFFRAPARYVAVLHVGMAFATALSFTILTLRCQQKRALSWPRIAPLLSIPALSAAILLYVVFFRAFAGAEGLGEFNRHVMSTPAIAVGTLLVLVASALVCTAARGSKLALLLLLALILADVSLYNLRHKPSKDITEIMAAIPIPPGSNTDRVEPNIMPYTMNQIAMHGFRNVTGYLNLAPQTNLDYSRPEVMQLAGVRWRESRHGTSAALHAAREEGIAWIELPDPMPRLRLVGSAHVTDEPATDLAGIDISATALLFEPVALDESDPGSLELVVDAPGSVTVKTDTADKQLLVFAENYHPGWRVHVDSKPSTVLRAYGDFMGCVVPPGTHTIHFSFWPSDLVRGLFVSGVALLLTLIFLVHTYHVGRRSESLPAVTDGA